MSATLGAAWHRWDESRVDRLARELFAWQAAHLPVAARVAPSAVAPTEIRGWRDVPWLPVQVHKRVPFLANGPSGRELRTAGTSGGPVGLVRLSPEGCDVAMAATISVVEAMLPGIRRKRLVLGMYPGPSLAPANAVVLAVAGVIDRLGLPGSCFVGSGAGMDRMVVIEALRAASEGGHPLLLIGGTEELIGLMEQLLGAGVQLRGVPDVVIVHTGGRRDPQHVGDARLIDAAGMALGLAPERCVNCYNLTETATPFLENSLRDGPTASRVKVAPPWVRVQAIDPFSLRPVAPGRVGLLAILDLACLDRPFHVLTDDLGFVLPQGPEPESHFVLMGRASAAELTATGRMVDRVVGELGAA